MSDKAAAAKEEGSVSKNSEKESESAEASLNLSEIRELAELVNEFGFTDFKFENENIKIRLSKQTGVQMAQNVPSTISAPQVSAPDSSAATAAPTAEPAEDLQVITSPIVGTFYRAPGPDKDPYVKEGSLVSPDSVVCIVEAMKLMNEIQAEISGEVVKIFVENGQPVEYGQPLFGIRK